MSQIKEGLYGLEFYGQGLELPGGITCYLHNQFGVSSAYACFEDGVLVIFEQIEAKGNHQSASLRWNTIGSLSRAGCSGRDFFCPVFRKALEEDPGACSAIPDFEDYCSRLKESLG